MLKLASELEKGLKNEKRKALIPNFICGDSTRLFHQPESDRFKPNFEETMKL